MNLKRYRRLFRLMACITILGIIGPMCPTPVYAQGTAPMQVGVVEFRNDSGVQGSMLARSATDAVVIELSKSNRFDVITRAQIDKEMQQLGLRPPLSTVELSRLGEALAAEAMIEGSIKSVEVRGDAGTRRASATIVVRMIDQSSGEVINGAVQTGFSRARVGDQVSDDQLIGEAVDNASYLAVKTMLDYIIPEATVQNTVRTNEVLLNKGARDGMRPGMRMIVTRKREVIGELNIAEVDPFDSIASITKQIRGIGPEDKARAVFDMPTIDKVSSKVSNTSSAPPSRGLKKSGAGKAKDLLITLGILFAVSQLWRNHGESVGDVTAEPAVASDGTAGVRVSWRSGSLGKGLNVTSYNIWRDNGAAAIASVDPTYGLLSYLDTTATVGAPHQYYVTATYNITQISGSGTSSGGTGSGTGTSTGSSGSTTTSAETEKKAATGFATPLPRMMLANLTVPVADSQQNLHKVTFQWLSQLGADTYIIEVSTDPIFAHPEFVSSTVTARPSPAGQTVSLTVNETLYTLFKSVLSTQPIYWRVGAKASGDNPGPVPPPGRPNSRYIFSEINAFRPVAPVGP